MKEGTKSYDYLEPGKLHVVLLGYGYCCPKEAKSLSLYPSEATIATCFEFLSLH